MPHSIRQIYVGVSPKHAIFVVLVLNPDSSAIIPQFHCVMDEWFVTITTTSVDDFPDFNGPEWLRLFGDSVLQYNLDDHDPTSILDDNYYLSDTLELFVDDVRLESLKPRTVFV